MTTGSIFFFNLLLSSLYLLFKMCGGLGGGLRSLSALLVFEYNLIILPLHHALALKAYMVLQNSTECCLLEITVAISPKSRVFFTTYKLFIMIHAKNSFWQL